MCAYNVNAMVVSHVIRHHMERRASVAFGHATPHVRHTEDRTGHRSGHVQLLQVPGVKHRNPFSWDTSRAARRLLYIEY